MTHPSDQTLACLESVLKLGAQTSTADMPDEFICALRNLLPGVHLFLYEDISSGNIGRIYPKYCPERVDAAMNEHLHGAVNAKNDLCGNKEILMDDKTIYPLRVSNFKFQYLVVKSKTLGDRERKMIDLLVSIYLSHYESLKRSRYDSLTGLLNREAFDEELKKSLAALRSAEKNPERRKETTGNESVLALMDIDHFKSVNDELGHLVGDQILEKSAQLMSACLRSEDKLFRYGGEEFAVLLNKTNKNQTYAVLERIRNAFEANNFEHVGKRTISIGFTELSAEDDEIDAISRADKALYEAKNTGRNKVSSRSTTNDHPRTTKHNQESGLETL